MINTTKWLNWKRKHHNNLVTFRKDATASFFILFTKNLLKSPKLSKEYLDCLKAFNQQMKNFNDALSELRETLQNLNNELFELLKWDLGFNPIILDELR